MNSIYFIGIGGIGMSALARLFNARGEKVAGSDEIDSELISDLRKEGIEVKIGHDKSNIKADLDLVIITEAIDENNEELKAAREKNIKILTCFQALGELSRDYFTIAVSGTHGKTTTTAMIALIMIEAGLDPTVVIGTKVREFGNKNMRIGKSKYLVVEACEYRRSFLHLHPDLILINNIEPDHLDYYKDEQDYRSAFDEFAARLPEGGKVVMGDRHGQDMAGGSEIALRVPGEHNRKNAMAACAVCKELGVEEKVIFESLNKFTGTWRRFEFKGTKNGIDLYDDYAHHPTEINATLQAFCEKFLGRRLVLVYQPHQYSRTKKLFNGFVEALSKADVVIIPDIYKVRDSEEDVNSVSAEELVDEIKKINPNAYFGNGFKNTVKMLDQVLKKGDVLITMGAGPVNEVGERWMVAREKTARFSLAGSLSLNCSRK